MGSVVDHFLFPQPYPPIPAPAIIRMIPKGDKDVGVMQIPAITKAHGTHPHFKSCFSFSLSFCGSMVALG